ncbi:hypothetical protein [Aquirhabdus sp.]|uniref:hypothetical protein n=1 Tax=Aquirhabdus sp. TaxID=2824160 RepID=UPI00396CD18B
MIQPLKSRLSHWFLSIVRSSLALSGLQRHGALVVALALHATCNPAFADDALPSPSNLEDAKSDVLQLDRDLAHLKQRMLLPERTVLLFGLTPRSQLSVQSVQISIDGKALPIRQYDQSSLGALLKGGMDTVMDANLKTGIHMIDIVVVQTNRPKLTQRIEFTKTISKDILAVQLLEHPGVGERPLRLVEWSQHD